MGIASWATARVTTPDLQRISVPAGARSWRVGRTNTPGHCRQVALTVRRADRGGRQLRIGQFDVVRLQRFQHLPHMVAADLMAQPTRAGVDHRRHLTFTQPKSLRDLTIKDPVNDLQLDEVIARAEASQFPDAAGLRTLTHMLTPPAGNQPPSSQRSRSSVKP